MGVLPLVYAAGVIVGLIVADASPGRRLALALAWPMGVAAFAITISVLTAAAAVLFPRVSAGVGTAGLLLWWLGS